MFSKLRKFLSKYSIFGIASVVLVSLCYMYLCTNRLSRELIESTALHNAEAYSVAIEELRSLYSSEIIANLGADGVEVTHDYMDKSGAIPLPATFSMLFARSIGEKEGGQKARLYSDYPFPWREDGGANDKFERDALDYLKANPDGVYYKFEDYGGQRSLRFAKADLMRESCIKCHNTHPLTPKSDWKVGDVRGILEVIVPVDTISTCTQKLILRFLTVIALFSLLVAFIIVRMFKK